MGLGMGVENAIVTGVAITTFWFLASMLVLWGVFCLAVKVGEESKKAQEEANLKEKKESDKINV